MCKGLGPGNLTCLYSVKQKGQQVEVRWAGARKVRECSGHGCAQGFICASHRVPCMWPGTQRTVGAVVGILSALR